MSSQTREKEVSLAVMRLKQAATLWSPLPHTQREKQAGCFLKGKDSFPGYHVLLKSPEAQEGPQEIMANR